MIDRDDKDNIITVGNVNLDIVEDGYVNSQPVVAHQIVNKAPKVQNTGNTNEYVFLTVRVPKRHVTLLYEDTAGGHKEGEKMPEMPKNIEIFKIQTNATPSSTDVDTNTDNYVDFKYHNGTDPDSYAEGWILLSGPTEKTDSTTSLKYDEYTFGYNKMLTPNETTLKPLFDKVQLKSFIDQEVTTNNVTQIDIQAYGIQTRNLGISDWTDNKVELTTNNIKDIFNIIKNKKNIT